MAGMHLVGTNGSIDLTLDGLIFRRTTSAAASRGVARLHHVDWARVDRATIVTSGKGKPVVEIQVAGAPHVESRRHDPHAVKVKRRMLDDAQLFVDQVNSEVATRRRWDAAAAVDA
ncbi:hypothetical protein GCM10023350_01610 [Nocardioides endophyticus]|uniref:Uncharacterized protein n=1 Tax=Nocardioides endophyticus TaxID=1353775 RepID=A0ABP8Y6R4_9ACTN